MSEIKKDLLELNQRLCETASKFSHDISGKLHVMQFCIDEMLDRDESLAQNELFIKFSRVMEELCAFSGFYRDYIPSELSLDCENSLEMAVEKALRTAQVYHLKKREWIKVHIVDIKGDCTSCGQVSEVLFSIFSYCLDVLESGELNPLEFHLGLKVLDSGLVTIKLVLRNRIVTEAGIRKYYESGSYKSKNLRGSYGLSIIKNMSVDQVNNDTTFGIVF